MRGCQAARRQSHLYSWQPQWGRDVTGEIEGALLREREKKKARKVSFKHAPPGSACQNTLPSSNWVIFDTPYNTVPVYWWGRVRVPRACEASLAPNQSRHKHCPQTIWQAQARTGTRTSKNMAPQLPPAPPGCNWYMGIPAHFQRRKLNPHVYYEIGHFVPSLPTSFLHALSCPPPSLQLNHRFSALRLDSFLSNYQVSLCLTFGNRPRFWPWRLRQWRRTGMLNPRWVLLTRFHSFEFVSGRVCYCISACWCDFLC